MRGSAHVLPVPAPVPNPLDGRDAVGELKTSSRILLRACGEVKSIHAIDQIGHEGNAPALQHVWPPTNSCEILTPWRCLGLDRRATGYLPSLLRVSLEL